LCRCGIIETRHLPPELREGPLPQDAGDEAKASLRELERRLMTQALEHHGGNRSAAARELSMHPSTFYRKAKALGLSLPSADGRHRQTT
jgi:DNA-binding NtrC family response regulator